MSEDLFITREDLKDYIHSIHNFLRNNGAGYGAMGMKIFNVFYGLKLIQPYLNEFKLSDEQKQTLDFNELVKKANDNNIEIMEYIDTKVSDVLYDLKNNDKNDDSNNLGHLIYHQMPRGLKDNVWKDFIKKIEKIPVGYSKERKVNLSGKVYEYFVGRDKNSISELGAYFTDRHITDFIYNKLQPTLDDNNNVKTMIDPFGGSGGFTLGYAFYLRNKFDNINWSNNVDNIYHFDMEESVVNMTGLEMFAVTGAFPKRELNYERVNSFRYEFSDSMNNKKYHYVISNPPYGGDKTTKSTEQIKRDKIINYIKSLDNKDDYKDQLKELKILSDDFQKNQEKQQVNLDSCSKRIRDFAKKYKLNGTDKEACSLILLADMLDTNGTAIGVLKEGVFFNRTYKDLRKCLVENYNVREVISVPSDQFENTSTKTSIIVFDNTKEKTSEVKFYDLVVERYNEDKFVQVNGRIKITDNKDDILGITDTLVSVASREEILANDICSLNGKDYNKKVIVCGEGYELVRLEDVCEFKPKSKRKASEGKKEGKYNFYTSSDKVQKCDVADYKDECLIIGSGGLANIKLDKEFSCSADNFIVKTKYNKYIYYLIFGNMNILIDGFTGSVLKHLSKEYLINLQIPIPKSEQKLKEWVEKISKPYDEKNSKQNKIKELEEYVKNKIKDIGENEDCEEVELGSICDTKSGEYIIKAKMIKGLYPVYGGGNISNYINIFNRENELIINKDGVSENCIKIEYGKFFLNHHGWTLIHKNNDYRKYINNWLLNNQLKIFNLANGSAQQGINKINFLKLKIKIPKNKQLINDLEPTFDEIEKLIGEVKEAETLYNQLIKELSDEAIPANATNAASPANANNIIPANTQELSNSDSVAVVDLDVVVNNTTAIKSSSTKTSSATSSSTGTSSIKSLHEQCKSLGIKGYSKYKKIEDKEKILKLIEEHK
jgi:type I restriction-modification system DNA methylase subunit